VANERDPKNDLAVWLGEQLREARLAAGITSQEALSRELGYDRTTINKVETGASPASDDVAIRIANRFPGIAGGNFVDLSDVARRMMTMASKHPGWFGKEWGPTEAESTALRWWEPLLIPGSLQTADYARALFRARNPAASDEQIEAMVNDRMARQAILDRATPPYLRIVLDELVVHRLIGSSATMYAQLMHVAEMSLRPSIAVQLLPVTLGANAGSSGAFILAEPSGTVCLETAIDAQITADPGMRERVALVFEGLTEEALPASTSRDRILKAANEKWNA
jgi:DNA-binding XRE family transcriptional regulator